MPCAPVSGLSAAGKRTSKFPAASIRGRERASRTHHSDGWRVGKQYLMAQLGAALSDDKLQILDGLRDGKEIDKQLADYQVELTTAGNMTMNAAAGTHDDYVAAMSMAWFGLMHCASSLGPPRDVRL